MDLTGTGFIVTIQKPDNNLALALRVNQQITATILSLAKDRAVLSVRGVKVEARLSSPEQQGLLENLRQAQFLVKGVTNQAVKLQLVSSPTASTNGTTPALLSPLYLASLSKAMLSKFNLPQDDSNLQIVQSLLSRGMDVDAKLVKELRQTLDQTGVWDSRELNTAVQVKAAGLPLTASSIKMLLDNSPEISKVLLHLRDQLQQLLSSEKNQNLASQLARPTQQHQLSQLDASTQSTQQHQLPQMAKNVLNQLESFIVQWSNSSQSLQQGIQRALELISRSLEQDLAEVVLSGQKSSILNNPETLMLSLAVLRSNAAQQGLTELTKAIDQFVEHFRSLQFINLPSQTEPSHGQWVQLDIPLYYLPEGTDGGRPGNMIDEYNKTRLRIAYRSGGQHASREVDPNYTRLVVQVDISPEETLDVDLSIANHKIGAVFTASSENIKRLAEEELPDLQEGFADIGYDLETSRFQVGKSSSILHDSIIEENNNKTIEPSLADKVNKVDMEI